MVNDVKIDDMDLGPAEFLEMLDEDFDNLEDLDLIASYDPSMYDMDEIHELVGDFEDEVFYTQGLTSGDYWVEEKVSLDITDQIDWDSLDYE